MEDYSKDDLRQVNVSVVMDEWCHSWSFAGGSRSFDVLVTLYVFLTLLLRLFAASSTQWIRIEALTAPYLSFYQLARNSLIKTETPIM